MKIFLLLMAMILIASFPFISGFVTDRFGHPAEQAEKIVEEYIMKNPKKIIESVRRLERDEADRESKESFAKSFEENKNDILDFSYPNINKDSDGIVVVEFFDYSCGYCKRMKNTLNEFGKAKGVTFIFRDFPILGESSILASRFALAVNMVDSEKYFQFHSLVLSSTEKYNNDVLMKFVEEVFNDQSKAQKVKDLVDSQDPKLEAMLNRTYELAAKLGIKGTPAFIVGDKLHVGFLSSEDLEYYVKDNKSSGGH